MFALPWVGLGSVNRATLVNSNITRADILKQEARKAAYRRQHAKDGILHDITEDSCRDVATAATVKVGVPWQFCAGQRSSCTYSLAWAQPSGSRGAGSLASASALWATADPLRSHTQPAALPHTTPQGLRHKSPELYAALVAQRTAYTYLGESRFKRCTQDVRGDEVPALRHIITLRSQRKRKFRAVTLVTQLSLDRCVHWNRSQLGIGCR